MALLDDDLSQPAIISSNIFRITTIQKEDPFCITLQSCITSGDFPPWIEVKGLSPELRLLWHHRNNLSVDDNGVIWRKRSSQSHMLQLLVPKLAQRTVVPVVSCVFVWRSFGPEQDIGPVGASLLLVGHVR